MRKTTFYQLVSENNEKHEFQIYLKDKHGVSAKDLKQVKKDNVLAKWVEHGAPELDMNFDAPIPDDIFGNLDAFFKNKTHLYFLTLRTISTDKHVLFLFKTINQTQRLKTDYLEFMFSVVFGN